MSLFLIATIDKLFLQKLELSNHDDRIAGPIKTQTISAFSEKRVLIQLHRRKRILENLSEQNSILSLLASDLDEPIVVRPPADGADET